MITTPDVATLSDDLARNIADSDARTLSTESANGGTPPNDPTDCFGRLERYREIHEARKRKLIDEVRSFRFEMGAVGLGVRTFDRQPVARSKVPDLICEAADQEPAVRASARPSSVAPLEVPDRITKRDYNYFGALNAALAALPANQRSS
jgi:hypothetical protein